MRIIFLAIALFLIPQFNNSQEQTENTKEEKFIQRIILRDDAGQIIGMIYVEDEVMKFKGDLARTAENFFKSVEGQIGSGVDKHVQEFKHKKRKSK